MRRLLPSRADPKPGVAVVLTDRHRYSVLFDERKLMASQKTLNNMSDMRAAGATDVSTIKFLINKTCGASAGDQVISVGNSLR
jgi:hypothetical protein